MSLEVKCSAVRSAVEQQLRMYAIFISPQISVVRSCNLIYNTILNGLQYFVNWKLY